MKKEILEKVIKISLSLLVFLLPLFWLPFSFEVYEFNKLYLAFFLVSIALLAWLIKMVFADREFRFLRSPTDIPIILFLLVAITSFIFSVDKQSSIFGFYGRFSNGLISLLTLAIFGFLITNNTSANRGQKPSDRKEKQEIFSPVLSTHLLLKLFLWACFLVVLISYFSIFGVWQKISEFLPVILQRVMLLKSFNTVSGSLEGLATFISIAVVLLTGLMLCSGRDFKKIFFKVLLIASFGILMIVDFNPAWMILIAGLGFLMIFALATRAFKENVNQLLLPIVLIVVSIAFVSVIDVGKGPDSAFSLPSEQFLGQQINWRIALSTVKDSFKNILLGSGIGTWHYDFIKHKPAELNMSRFWQIRFDRSGNHISEILTTVGVLGIASYILVIASFFLAFGATQQKKEFLPFAATFFAILSSQYFYYQNTTLAFMFWFILGLSAVVIQLPERFKRPVKISLSFKKFPELNLILPVFLILFCLFVVGTFYFGSRLYLADINYAKAQSVLEAEDAIGFLKQSVILNPTSVTYRIVLSKVYLLSISQELEKPPSEQDAAKIQNQVALAVEQAQAATIISPNNVVVWEMLGVIYREIQALVEDAANWAIQSFEKAATLEDKNPVLYTEIGKLYLGAGDLEKARENFVKAKEVKSDYLDAFIQEALTYEIEENLDEAISKMEELIRNYSQSTEARFQLGRIYFNQGRTDEAVIQFETIIIINPNHSNALYSLGMAYAAQGEAEKAILALERVLELNPGNQDVIQKLEELKEGE